MSCIVISEFADLTMLVGVGGTTDENPEVRPMQVLIVYLSPSF